jgi:hypothetical protein
MLELFRRRRVFVPAGTAALLAIGGGTALGLDHGRGGNPLPPAKQAVLDHQFGPQVGAAPPARKDPNFQPPPDPPKRPPGLGVVRYTDLQAPVSPAVFTPTSAWTDWRGNLQIEVLAGSSSKNTSHSLLYLSMIDVSNNTTQPGTGVYNPGQDLGPLTLTGVTGSVVKFRYAGGSGSFNLETKAFALG